MTESESLTSSLNIHLSSEVGLSRGKILSYQAVNRILAKYEAERSLDDEVNGGANSFRLTCCIEALLLAQKEILGISAPIGLVGAA